MAVVAQISPRGAWEILQSDPDSVLLDVRSRVEFDYVGHPIGAVNVPWQEAPDWRIDPDFVDKVREQLARLRGARAPERTVTVLAMCRSGRRSDAAATALADAGFQKVYNIDEGFEGDRDAQQHRGTLNGWRFHGLPWEQT